MHVQELTAMARLAIHHADGGEHGEAKAQRIETRIDRLALANGYTVDDVYAPIIAERFGYQWLEPVAA
jgi:hypothetical protein